MAEPIPNPEELKKLRVVDLKERLQAIGLTSSGLKADLVERLLQYYVERAQGSEASMQQVADPHAQMLQQQHEQQMLFEQQRQQEEQQSIMRHQQLMEQQREQEEQQRIMEQQRLIEQQRQQEEHQRMVEQQRLMQQRQQDQQQMIEQQRIQEQQRLLEQQRLEEQRIMEQQRLLEEQRQREEQQRILEQQLILEQQQQHERQRQEEERRMMEQQQRMMIEQMEQQKEAMARQQAAMLEEEKRRQEQEAIMQNAVRQQQMLEAAKHQQLAAEQQRLAMEQQQQQQRLLQEQALAEQKKREEEELFRQQQIALLEKQREEQQTQQRLMEEQTKRNLLPPPDFERGAPPELRVPPPELRGPPPPDQVRPPPLMSIETGPPSIKVDTLMDENEAKDIKLPHALEKVLAFKDVRAQQVGVKPEDIENEIQEPKHDPYDDDELTTRDVTQYDDDDEDETVAKQKTVKESKNKKRKKKKKRTKQRHTEQNKNEENLTKEEEPDVEIEYVQEQLDIQPGDPHYHTFSRIFEAFKISEPEKPKDSEKTEQKKDASKTEDNLRDRSQEDDDDSDEEEKPDDDDKPKLSKKKLKKMNRLSVAELKQLVSRPDVVEMHDVTAQDPKLLVHLKATRNSVPVPRHWCFKRKYLQGKRGIEKPPFELPDYIKATGIMEMREALQEKEDQKTLKSKMRERVRPKMGKIDIDYQKLHDAFFRWQSKPKMTIHGDLYYEGKEFETRLKEKKPGNITDDLRTALGMPIGPNSDKVPPPWLIAMQRYGPPPSYPNLKIPGLNAPIPESCSFGYHAGGWGKPPVDENGKPLYGDVFGTQGGESQPPVPEETIDHTLWGELESESESEVESEEESEEEDVDKTGLITPGDAGLVTPSGLTSVPAGMETPDMIELRKRRIEDNMDQGGDTPALYQVLPEKKAAVGGAMMGSAHVYDIAAAAAAAAGKRPPERVQAEGIDIALNPEELDLDTAAMQAKYEQTVREQQSQLEKEDLSDMVAEHAAKQQKKRKKQQQEGNKAKKYKEFKF